MRKFCILLLFVASYAFGQTAGASMPFVKPQFFNNSGAPATGAKLCTYAAGTSTPQDTYFDADLAVGHKNSNPVLLDALGRPTSGAVFMSAVAYKFVLLTAGTDNTCGTGSQIWSYDNVNDIGQLLRANLAASSGATLLGFLQAGANALTNETMQDKGRQIIAASDFAGTNAGQKIARCIAATPNGGICDASMFSGAQISSQDVFSSIVNSGKLKLNGVFSNSTTWTVPANWEIEGVPGFTALKASALIPIFTINGANVAIHDLTMDGNSVGQDAIYCKACDHLHVYRTEAKNTTSNSPTFSFGDAVHINDTGGDTGGSFVTIENNYFHDLGRNGVFSGQGDNLIVKGNRIINYQLNGVDIEPDAAHSAAYGMIDGNYISSNATGAGQGLCVFITPGAGVRSNVYHWSVLNTFCPSSGTTESAFAGTDGSFHIDADYATIRGNTILSAAGNGAFIAGTHNKFTHNTVLNSGQGAGQNRAVAVGADNSTFADNVTLDTQMVKTQGWCFGANNGADTNNVYTDNQCLHGMGTTDLNIFGHDSWRNSGNNDSGSTTFTASQNDYDSVNAAYIMHSSNANGYRIESAAGNVVLQPYGPAGSVVLNPGLSTLVNHNISQDLLGGTEGYRMFSSATSVCTVLSPTSGVVDRSKYRVCSNGGVMTFESGTDLEAWTIVAQFNTSNFFQAMLGYAAPDGTAGADCPAGVTAGTVVVKKGIVVHC